MNPKQQLIQMVGEEKAKEWISIVKSINEKELENKSELSLLPIGDEK